MRLNRLLLSVALTTMMFLPIAAPATAGPTDARPSHADDRGAASAVTPEQALAAVEAAFDGAPAGGPSIRGRGPEGAGPTEATGRSELTLALAQLRQLLPELAPADRQTARAYLARPTDANEPFGASYGKRARPTSDCRVNPTPGSPICVHWAQRTTDAPKLADRDNDGVPNQVERTRRVVNRAWKRAVTEGGYRRPLKDGRGPRGHRGKLDVYLVNIGAQGIFGYCSPERQVSGYAYTGYCVLDDDYSRKEFPFNTPTKNLKVTAAHEFFHAVQFAYDALEDAWFMESTATWFEDEVFDAINDNRFFLQQSSLSDPEAPLDYSNGLFVYGNWIWWRFLTETFPATQGTGLPVLVRDVWDLADGREGAVDMFSMEALSQELSDRGQSLAGQFHAFGLANRRPTDFYEEGSAYRPAPRAARHDLGPGGSRGPTTRILDHMSNATIVFSPSGSPPNGQTITLTLNIPDLARGARASVVVIPGSGPVQKQAVPLNASGDGNVEVAFDNDVRRVELTLTNGGHDYLCWQERAWSCEGTPQDDNLPFVYSATVGTPAASSGPEAVPGS